MFADMPWYQQKVASVIFATPPTSSYMEVVTLCSVFTRAKLCVKRVIAVASCPSGWLAVCHSRYCMKTETASVMISSPSDIPLI